MRIENHRLVGPGVDYVECSKKSGQFKNKLRFIVMHYTGGGSRDSSVRHFLESDTKASAHIVVGRDQKITQLVNFNEIAWHAGESEWQEYQSLNSCSIGIELDNAGKLEKRGQNFYTWFNKKIDRNYVTFEAGEYWHAYTEWQIKTVFQICQILMKEYKDFIDIVGHNDISPSRKIDPGPHFPMDKFRDKLFSKRDDIDNRIAKYGYSKTLLNVRNKPTPQGELLRKPLEPGERVKVIALVDGWAKVEVKQQGWVSSKYLDYSDSKK